jgi:hypothetical protein
MTAAEIDGAWAFGDPPTRDVATCWRILRGEEWIHYVAHDAGDGAWAFHPHLFAPVSESARVALKTIVALDPSVTILSDLPPGWCAWRDAKGAPWQRARQSDHEYQRR